MNSNPKYDALENRIKELEGIIEKAKAHVERRVDTLDQRHLDLSEEERRSFEGALIAIRISELQWVLEKL